MQELKWQWWQQVDKVKWKCDSMFLALEEPMKMGLAWFVFSLSPLPHPSTKVMTSQLAVSWVCVTSMFSSEIAATTRQSDATIAMKNTNWSKGGRKIDGNKKESFYNFLGHPYVGERSMKTWCHEVGRMVLWVPAESLLLPWSFTQHGTAKCGSKSPNRWKTHTSPRTSVCNQIPRINLAPRRIWGWECSLLGWTTVQIVFGLKLRQPCLSFWISKNMVAQLIEWLRRRCMDTGSRGGRKHVLLQIAPPLWKQSLKGL